MTPREFGSTPPTPVVREARPADADAVAAFTRDTWGDRQADYIPSVFPRWAASDDPDRGTFVATLPPDAIAVSDLTETSDGRVETPERAEGDTLVEGDGDGLAAPGEPEAVVGCIQGVLLTEWEAWGQGIRVDPAARGFGVGTALSTAALDWARDRGATVCRNMVFSWNVAGLGQSRAAGFEPATEFRFALPEPSAEVAGDVDAESAATDPTADEPAAADPTAADPTAADPAAADPTAADSTAADSTSADPAAEAVRSLDDPDPNAAWAFWTGSDAREHLGGLALHGDEPWACSELTRRRLTTAADENRLLGVADADGFAAFAVRTRISERSGGDECGGGGPERVAEYGAAAWRDVDAAGVLYTEIAADAAAVDADAARVLIPETVEHVSDTGANRVPVAAEPDFVLRADLTAIYK